MMQCRFEDHWCRPCNKCFCGDDPEPEPSTEADEALNTGTSGDAAIEITPAGQANFTIMNAFLPSGNDIESGFMTLADARQKCLNDPNAAAITYEGKPDMQGEVEVWIKAHGHGAPSADAQWTVE